MMRKIEEEMVDAVRKRRSTWRGGNTSVNTVHGRTEVFLHSHHIATIKEDGEVEVNKFTLRKWPTVTTKSRLRALGVDVRTKNHVTYLNGEAV